MTIERRNYERFRVNERAFVGLIATESNVILQLGQIMDISRGGVCSYHITTKKIMDSVSHVSIFGQTAAFVKVEKIPCKIVYDKQIPWSDLQEIRCGIKFLSQSSSQESQIEAFIRVITNNVKPIH